ncbi:putative Serine/threonine-protein phosphatase [Blattamonas nauphoetae]|uniref:Serine/threonine-protein phosphatase n=1 Tax=Blattamonas nauphoetae TaxID=2049346 RepID=A0ABQ9XXB8_9EUKA|nr:putative Serine/threonine-protein phosphatase [Blattamonas nauphoetae]
MSKPEIDGIESLHNHTTTSDGLLTHFEFLEQARDNGFAVVAFTDHDALPPLHVVEELQQPKWKADFPTKYIWGIEMTSSPPKETGMTLSDFHVVGLFVDPKNERLRQYCANAQHARKERMKFIVEGLKKHGFKITEEDCLRESGGESVGRPHIVRALQAYPENDTVMTKLVEDFETATVANPSLKEKYPEVQTGPNLWRSIYQILLKKDAFFPDAYMDIERADLVEAADLIHEAGGIAILAHYFTVQRSVTLEMCREWMKKGYLDGMETFYGLGMRSDNPTQFDEQKEAIKKMCIEEQKVWFVGGGDIHQPEGIKLYAESKKASTKINDDEKVLNEKNEHIADLEASLLRLTAAQEEGRYRISDDETGDFEHNEDIQVIADLEAQLKELKANNILLQNQLRLAKIEGKREYSHTIGKKYQVSQHAAIFRTDEAMSIPGKVQSDDTETVIQEDGDFYMERAIPAVGIIGQLLSAFESNDLKSPPKLANAADAVIALCEEARSIFALEQKVLFLRSPIYIFGDIHGNYKDLQFYMNRFNPIGRLGFIPHKLLFLGDYVDRGTHSVQVVLRLFLDKICTRNKIFLLRGNHELSYVNSQIEVYGYTCLRVQCASIFKDRGEEVFWAINRAFDCLPIAAIIDKELICMHGGVPRPNYQEPSSYPVPDPLIRLPKAERQGMDGTSVLNSARMNSSATFYPGTFASPSSILNDPSNLPSFNSFAHYFTDGTKPLSPKPKMSTVNLSALLPPPSKKFETTSSPTQAPVQSRPFLRSPSTLSLNSPHSGYQTTMLSLDDRLAAILRFPPSLPGTIEFSEECQLLSDVLWGDPAPSNRLLDEDGFCVGDRGEESYMFGEIATKRFLEANQLTMLIRGHEDRHSGMEVSQNQMVFTVFSSSNYRDSNSAACLFCFEKRIHVVVKQSHMPKSLTHDTNAPRYPTVLNKKEQEKKGRSQNRRPELFSQQSKNGGYRAKTDKAKDVFESPLQTRSFSNSRVPIRTQKQVKTEKRSESRDRKEAPVPNRFGWKVARSESDDEDLLAISRDRPQTFSPKSHNQQSHSSISSLQKTEDTDALARKAITAPSEPRTRFGFGIKKPPTIAPRVGRKQTWNSQFPPATNQSKIPGFADTTPLQSDRENDDLSLPKLGDVGLSMSG